MDNREVILDLGRRDFTAAETRLRELLTKYQGNPAARDRFARSPRGRPERPG